MRKTDGQSGEVMLEAAIIFIPVLILLFALLSLSFLFYQEAMMNSVAYEIAEDVAEQLKYGELGVNADPGHDDYANTRMFRLTFRKGKVEREQQERAEAHAEWRIPLSTLGFGSQEAQVDCTVTLSGIGRAYVKVTVKQKTGIFLGGVLELAGVTNGNLAYGGTAYAECVDLMGYTTLINFTEYVTNILGNTFGAVGDLYSNVKDLMENIEF